MANFNYLFSPIKVGSKELPNRIILAPHDAGLPRGSVQEIEYLGARVKGGVGTVILQTTLAVPTAWHIPVLSNLYTEEGIQQNEKTVVALQKLGAKVLIEMMILPGLLGTSSVSNHTAFNGNVSSRSMTTAEIKQAIQDYASSVENAKRIGADGVDVYAANGAAINLFLSPLYNRRTDEYGGSMENRMRFLMELLDEIRERCGDDFIVGVDLNVDEEMLGGYTLEEGVEIARILAETKKVDYLRIDAHNVKPQEGHFHYPSSYMPTGLMLYAAAAVREVVDIPVIGTHKINSAEFAEQALAEGQCDAVCICRALIADPELPNKAKRGEIKEIRACIGCMEGCYQRLMMGQPIGCSVNPDVGCEHLGNTIIPTEKSKKVVIAGGGLAGMEAALVAAKRGHEVILLEKSGQLGGHVNLQAQLPGLGDRSDIVRWFSLQLNKEKIDIRLNTEATPELVQSLMPDSVVVATGSNYSELGISPDVKYPIEGYELDYVLTPEKVMLEDNPVGQNVVIYDTTDYVVGPGLAEMFADQGKDVTLITASAFVADSLDSCYVNRAVAMRIFPKVNYVRDTAVIKIEDHVLSLRNKYTFEESTLEGVDTIVLVTTKIGNEALYHKLVGKVPELYVIGDADTTHYGNFGIDAAIKSGLTIGKML